MKEEAISSATGDPRILLRSSSPPPTPVASSAGASSPFVQTDVGNIGWLVQGQGSKATSLSFAGPHLPKTSVSTSAGGSALGSSQPSCRPWDRGDLLRRLATFKPSNWFGKPKVANSLACARRGWVNVGSNTIECEICGTHLNFAVSPSWPCNDANLAGEVFANHLDGHKLDCPWKGTSCAESLVQFPPTPPAALIGAYRDRCDGLLQFLSLPVISPLAIEQMRMYRGPHIDRVLSQSQSSTGEFNLGVDCVHGHDMANEEAVHVYSYVQKIISLCGWEPRWLPDVQDCEEHSTQSARYQYSVGLAQRRTCNIPDSLTGKNTFSRSARKEKGKALFLENRGDSRSPLLDCSLCGAMVRIWDFITVPRPARFGPNTMTTPETSKKLALTHGISATSAIGGWVAAEQFVKERSEFPDDAATADDGRSLSNADVDLNLTIAGGLSFAGSGMPVIPDQFESTTQPRDMIIGQPSGSEVGDRAVSYESRGPISKKRNMEEGGSTIDPPAPGVVQRADSVEGTVVDRDGDEVNDSREYSVGPSKRARESYAFSSWRNSSDAGPSNSLGFGGDFDNKKGEMFVQGSDQILFGHCSIKDSAHASSVIALDTICHDEDSMESVENFPGELDDIHFPSPGRYKSLELNETSELNNSNQAQQSTCFPPAPVRETGEMGVSSTIEGEEIMDAETGTTNARERSSFGASGGSVGMGASHEGEVHDGDVYAHRNDSVVGDAEIVAEITENLGQTGESIADPGMMGEFVPAGMDREDSHGDSPDMMSHSFERADSGSKVAGSTKGESGESGEKRGVVMIHQNIERPSLSYNAVIYSTCEASKEEVTQLGKGSLTDDCLIIGSDFGTNEKTPANGESCYDAGLVEFDPIGNHNDFCPWVNGNVAAAGCSNGLSSCPAVPLCGWQLTLDALDVLQSVGNFTAPNVESESAASLYKDDHLASGKKILVHSSVTRSRGQ